MPGVGRKKKSISSARAPRIAGSHRHLKSALVTGPIKPLPHRQLQTVLQTFMQLLEEEHSMVFGHNLGVQSGTAVVEDLKARQLYELCSRAESFITLNDKCMETFLTFCESLTPQMRNRVLTAFTVFDKQELLNYIKLIKPELVERVRKQKPKCVSEASLEHFLSPARTTQMTQAHKPFERQTVVRMADPEEDEWTSRVEGLREAGHPFLQLVDRMQEEKKRRQQASDIPSEQEAFILALRDGRITEELATMMHRMLKSHNYLDVRSKWLAGAPLQSALLENGSSTPQSLATSSVTPSNLEPPTSASRFT